MTADGKIETLQVEDHDDSEVSADSFLHAVIQLIQLVLLLKILRFYTKIFSWHLPLSNWDVQGQGRARASLKKRLNRRDH